VRPGRLRVTVPEHCPTDELSRFLAERSGWVLEKTRAWRELAAPGEGPVDPPLPGTGGGHLVFRGRRTPFRVTPTDRSRAAVGWDPLRGIVLRLPSQWAEADRERRAHRALARWYDALLADEADRVIETLGRPRGLVPDAVRFSQPRTRWGSCASNGIVRLNRRLVGAPAPVYRYVVIHELAHLRHRDHSPRFWALVQEMEPAWRTHRGWLRAHGVALG
jgi:predicted metal-dependent hydrolase